MAKTIRPVSTTYWFDGLDFLESIDLSGLDTSGVTDMHSMFSGCSSLVSLDLAPLDTSSVIYMGSMFEGCSSLVSLDLSGLDTSKAEGMGKMLDGCSALASFKTGTSWAIPEAGGSAFPVAMADESGASFSAGDHVPSGAHSYVRVEEVDISGSDVTVAGSFVYTGKKIEPAVTVELDGEAIPRESYAVSYSNNVNAGKATVTVTARGGGYTGTATTTFKIQAAPISQAVLAKASFAYTGKAQKPGVKSVKAGALALGRGDYAVKYTNANSTAAGAYKVTVTGKGNFKGSKAVSYKIVQAANSAEAAKTSVARSYTVKALKGKAAAIALPKVTAKFGKAAWKVTTADKKKVLTLKNGKVQVKKGARKGVYTVKLKATVAATKNYKAASTRVVTVKVTVK